MSEEPKGCGWPEEHCDFCWSVDESHCEECDQLVLQDPNGTYVHDSTCDYRGGPAVHFERDGRVRTDTTWVGAVPVLPLLVLRNQIRGPYVAAPALEAWADQLEDRFWRGEIGLGA